MCEQYCGSRTRLTYQVLVWKIGGLKVITQSKITQDHGERFTKVLQGRKEVLEEAYCTHVFRFQAARRNRKVGLHNV